MRRSLFVIGSSSSAAHLTLIGPDIAERQLSVRYRRGANGLGTFFLTNLDKAHSILVNGVETVLSPLEVGDRIEVAGHHLQLCQAAETVAWLEGYTDRNPGRMWELPPVDLPVGRRGTRVNRIEVDDQTVSRSHATLRWLEGQFHLEQESSNATKINGEHLLVGHSQALADGDLVQFGLHLFRFRVASSNPPQLASISVLATDLQCSALRGPTTHRAVDQVAQALGNLVGVLEGHGASLLPFMGERMVAVFRQDDHPARALKAAREIMRRARLPVCAGLHSGEMAVVSGHLHFRDCEEVARAAERIVAGRMGTTLVVSGATLARLHEQPEARRLDDVREGAHTLEVYQISL